jgi:hypothetical protein
MRAALLYGIQDWFRRQIAAWRRIDRQSERVLWVIALFVVMFGAFWLGGSGRSDDAIDEALAHSRAYVDTRNGGVIFDLFGREREMPCRERFCVSPR